MSATNRWKSFVSVFIGGVAGLLAMRSYWNQVAPKVKTLIPNSQNQAQEEDEEEPLTDVSLVGKQYRDGESSTAALGRILYTWITGSEPQTQEAKTMLSYQVHWIYGMFQGGMYGALHSNSPLFDLRGGLTYATGLWLFSDEMAVPLLGLQAGPAATPLAGHLNRWGAHLAYGSATAIATQFLRRLL